MSDRSLAQDVAQYIHDPVGFSQYAFPWGEGELTGAKGLRGWQFTVAKKIRDHLQNPETRFTPLLIAVASGHGIGKSALISILKNWGLSTCDNTKIITTANTATQLRTKTWSEVATWFRLSITRAWFKVTATAISFIDPKYAQTWRADAVPWSENNTEAFAGLHNKGKRIILFFDEASNIADKVWEVAEGALTDEETEIIWIAFGNPTRNIGRFRECFRKFKHRWFTLQVDSRDVEGTNKAQIAKWAEDWGEDSDFFRVRVRGMFPRASALQLIDTDVIAESMRREAVSMLGDPLIMTLDIARGGEDECAIRFRRGFDSRTIPPIYIPGSEVKDSMKLVSKVVDTLNRYKPDHFFYDGTGVGGPVGDRVRQLGYNVTEVQFGSSSPNPKHANLRAYMYVKTEEWLRAGGAIEFDPQLEEQLASVDYSHDKKDRLILESKESMKSRGVTSPDRADALAMSFAFPVAPTEGLGAGDSNSRNHIEYVPPWEQGN